jgi:hypothetical protein
MRQIAELLNHSVDEIRVWTLMTRYNFTVRPYTCVELKDNANKCITDVTKQDAAWNVFVETASDVSFNNSFFYASLVNAPHTAIVSELIDKQLALTAEDQSASQSSSSTNFASSPQQQKPATARSTLPSYTPAEEVMIFFKYYEPRTSTLRYVFKLYISKKTTLHAIQERVNRKMRFPLATDLLFYEEVRMSQIKPILVFDKPLDKLAHEELLTGDIYVFQVNEKERLRCSLPTVEDYFR